MEQPGDHVKPTSRDSCVVNYIEEGDPLQNDGVLLQSIRIAEPGDDGPNTIRKVPSDQLHSMYRWGSNHRMTGRSKSGLQILVPGREASATVITSGPLSGKSIIYTYASSSNSSGKTTNSLGAVGDHLPTGKTGFSAGSKLLAAPEHQSIKLAHEPTSTDGGPRSPLADLVADSTPDADDYETRAPLTDLVANSTTDLEPYKIFIAGEKGPCAKPITPRVVSLKNFLMLPSRRRSLSDLIEDTKTLHSPINISVPTSAISRTSTITETTSSDGTNNSCQGVSIHQPNIENVPEPLVAPVWKRAGPPFALISNEGAEAPTQEACLPADFDPPTFCFPFGSKIFVMKSPDIHSLRASVVTGVWSSSKGANRVLQNAWDSKTKNEKIVFLFSISHSHLYSGKYCGMAEMSGPYDPHVDPQFWIAGLRGNEGVIPTRWIVSKDVEFSVFVDLKYRGKFATELRHANTVPGEAGRSLVKAYFETRHSHTSMLHPQGQCTGMPPSVPSRTPVMPRKWQTPQTFTLPRRRFFQARSNTTMTPSLASQPTYGLTRGGEYRVRHGTKLPPPPPFLNSTENSRGSNARANVAPSRTHFQAGPSQSMMPCQRPHLMYGQPEGGIRLPSSHLNYAAPPYPSLATSSGQAPLNSTPRSASRPPITHTNGNGETTFYPTRGHGTLPFTA